MKRNVVIDTNVLMSGIFFGGMPRKILEMWYGGRFELVITEEIYTEYTRVLDELCLKYQGIDAVEVIYLVLSKSKMIKPRQLIEQVCADKDDDKFIACALSCNGTIISGDKALLACNGYQNLRVYTPRQFIT